MCVKFRHVCVAITIDECNMPIDDYFILLQMYEGDYLPAKNIYPRYKNNWDNPTSSNSLE